MPRDVRWLGVLGRTVLGKNEDGTGCYSMQENRNQKKVLDSEEWNLRILTQSKGNEPDSQVKNKIAYSFLLTPQKLGSLFITLPSCLTI